MQVRSALVQLDDYAIERKIILIFHGAFSFVVSYNTFFFVKNSKKWNEFHDGEYFDSSLDILSLHKKVLPTFLCSRERNSVFLQEIKIYSIEKNHIIIFFPFFTKKYVTPNDIILGCMKNHNSFLFIVKSSHRTNSPLHNPKEK